MNSEKQFFFSKRFFPLFVTQFFGAFNDNAFKNAFLIWYTFEAYKMFSVSPTVVVTLSAGLFILPFLLFSTTSGQLADKYEKSFITQVIKKIEIGLMGACALFFYFQSVVGLLVILFLMGMHSTFFGPIKYSLLPEHLKDEELIAGNAYIEGGTFLSILFGTIFGGVVIRSSQGLVIFSGVVILFAVIGWVASRFIPRAQICDPDLKIGFNVVKETLKIMEDAKEERTVWLSIIAISWFWAIGATFLTQFPVYTKDVLHSNEQMVTLLLTLFSIGIGVGSVLCNKLLRGKINGRLVPWGAAGISISIFLFKWATERYGASLNVDVLTTEKNISQFLSSGTSGVLILTSLLMLAVFSGIYIVPLYAIMQHRANPKRMSRVIAANNIINALFMVGASIFATVLFSLKISVTNVLFLFGLINIPIYFLIRKVVSQRLKSNHA